MCSLWDHFGLLANDRCLPFFLFCILLLVAAAIVPKEFFVVVDGGVVLVLVSQECWCRLQWACMCMCVCLSFHFALYQTWVDECASLHLYVWVFKASHSHRTLFGDRDGPQKCCSSSGILYVPVDSHQYHSVVCRGNALTKCQNVHVCRCAPMCACVRVVVLFSLSLTLFSALVCSALVFTSTIVCVVIFVYFHNCFKHSWDYCGSKGNRNHPLTITTCRQILFLLSFYSNMCLVCMHKCMFDLLFGITNNIPIERVSE